MPVAGDVLVEAVDVHHAYAAEEVLRGFDLSVRAGEAVALMGASGCGKSTGVLALAGLLTPTGGRVRLLGTDLVGLSVGARAALRRRHLGLVFQFGELVAELSLRDNVALAAELAGTRRREALARAQALLDRVGLGDLGARRPGQVSGGQRQRAAVARAVVHRPAVVLADEPTGALDSASAAGVLDLLLELARQEGCAVVMATHDGDVAARATRICRMSDGRVAEVARA